MIQKFIISLFVISGLVLADNTTYYVDGTNGSDSNNGTSAAFKTLNKAIGSAVSGDSIIVKAGTYKGSSNRGLYTQGKNLYIKSESGSAQTILDAESENRHFQIYYADTTFKLIGFTFKNGKSSQGGSIYSYGTNTAWGPVIESCVFDSNQATINNSSQGGAIYSQGNLVIRDVTFNHNYAKYRGGALYIDGTPDTTKSKIERTKFYGNYLEPAENYSSQGGAAYLGGNFDLVDCTFDSNLVKMNKSYHYGAAIYSYGQQQYSSYNDTIINIKNSVFKQNQLVKGVTGGWAYGGGIYITGYRKTIVENCLFDSNKSQGTSYADQYGNVSNTQGYGGAINIDIYDRYLSSSQKYETYNPVILINNTFVNNSATSSNNEYDAYGGGVYLGYREEATLFNNIFWGNTASKRSNNNDNDSNYNAYELNLSGENKISMANNSFQYYQKDKETSYNAEISFTNNMLGVNPSFKSSGNYPFELNDNSVLIGAGVASYNDYSSPNKDIKNGTRPNPSGSNPDIGAYENSLGTSPYPKQVDSVTVAVTDQQATLTWKLNSASNMASYKVYKSLESGFSISADSLAATVSHPSSGTTASATITGLTNKTKYYFIVTGIDTDGLEGTASSEVSATPYYNGPTWHVATAGKGGSDSNSGSSSSPFLTLKVAIDSAKTGHTVSIGSGTHQYSSASQWNIQFNGSKSLIIKGQGPDSTILDAQSKERHLTFTMDNAAIDTSFKVMDLTLTNGKPSWYSGGGSVYIEDYWNGSTYSKSGPLFQNVNFEKNSAKTDTSNEWNKRHGGAVYTEPWSSAYFRNCTFKYNTVIGQGGAVFAEGNYSSRGNVSTYENCTFTGNIADGGNSSFEAAGGAVRLDGPAVFISCVFDSNQVISNPNSMSNGGAIDMWIGYGNTGKDRIDTQIENSTFTNNSIVSGSKGGSNAAGGAIRIGGEAQVIITNSLFVSNEVKGGTSVNEWGTNYGWAYGGAIHTNISRIWNNNSSTYTYSGKMVVINSTFTKNSALGAGAGIQNNGRGGALSIEYAQQAFLFNNIVWGNTANGEIEADSSVFADNPYDSDFRASNNSVQFIDLNSYGDNNVITKPEFVGSGSTPYALLGRSGLLGAGVDSLYGYTAPIKDILGNARPNPSGSNPDLGAFENSLGSSPYPDQVTGLKAKGGDGSVTLTWTKNSESDVNKYYVYRHTESFTPAAGYAIDTVTTTTHISTGLNNSARYYFHVSAVNTSGYEGASATVDITPTFNGPVWHVAVVDSGGNDSNEGSEASPFNTFSHAVEHAANGDTIIFGDGTYSGKNNRDIELNGSKSLVIKSRNGASKTILDAGTYGRHINFKAWSDNDGQGTGTNYSNVDTNFQFIGLTFKNGINSEDKQGGSIRIEGTMYNSSGTTTEYKISPKFKDCVFKNNGGLVVEKGGAIAIYRGDPVFESCVFDTNLVFEKGGAVFVSEHSAPQFRNSTFTGNQASYTTVEYNNGQPIWRNIGGGAIYMHNAQGIKIVNCTFSYNKAQTATSNANGGAIEVSNNWFPSDDRQLIIDRSTFSYNSAASTNSSAFGGAISAGSPITIQNSLFYENIIHATYHSEGGAIHIGIQTRTNQQTSQEENGESFLINNTIVQNRVIAAANNEAGVPQGNPAGAAGGVGLSSGQNTFGTWFNNIFWANQAQGWQDIYWDSNFKLIFGNNVVEDIYGSQELTEAVTYSKYPNFTDTTKHLYSLSDASYLIGQGLPSFDGVPAPKYDINGLTRPNPAGSKPDVGAFENLLSTSPYPSQVTNLIGSGANKQAKLSWDSNPESDIVSYTVYMSDKKDFVPSSTDSIASVDTTYFITADTLTNKQEYFFAVVAVNQKGNKGDHSEVVGIVPYYRGPIWYVAVDGSNMGDGDILTPFADIQTAVDSSESGHTIILKAGTYQGEKNRNIQLTGQAGKTLRFQAEKNAGDVILDAQNSGYHFLIQGDYDSTLVFSNIKFIKGSGWYIDTGGGGGGNGVFGGSIAIMGYKYFDQDSQQDKSIYPTPKFISCHWEQNSAYGSSEQAGLGGAVFIQTASPSFHNCTFKKNTASTSAGAVYIGTENLSDNSANPTFYNCIFDANNVSKSSGGSISAGAVLISGGGKSIFYRSQFIDNYVSHSNDGAYGGAVNIQGNWDNSFENDIVFNQNLFRGNYAMAPNNNANGGAISAGAPFTLINSVLVENFAVSNNPSGGALSIDIFESNGTKGRSRLINNTIAFNELRNSGGTLMGDGGGISTFSDNQEGTWFNNIVYFNKSSYNQSISMNNSNIGIVHNNVDDGNGKPWFGEENLSVDPKFKNPSGDDYRLRISSAMIDAGTEGDGENTAPNIDHRSYYRVGIPDIGAYEFGASKYILDMVDDISALQRDTTYLARNQEFSVSMKTNDNEGNVVTASEPIQWFISPTDKHITIVSYDSVTTNGEAKVKVKATGITGFKFRVGAEIAEATRRTNVYIIEKLVTGAPKTITDITIDPSQWTNNNNFKISWTNPDTIGYGRDYLGALVQLGDEDPTSIVRHPDSGNFHVNSAQVIAPEMGEWTYKVWLFDELGNEDVKNADSVKAKFDEQPPDEFSIHYPSQHVWESDTPQFRWQASGDYPSGIESWAIFLNNNEYARFNDSEISYDSDYEEFYVDATASLADGYYTWFMEIRDMAGNVTNSRDTIDFGVDITPPTIKHDNPLEITNEGSTTPTIDVIVTDGASGVETAILHYRRAGTGSGFVSVDLLTGPVSIPAGDVKADGLEYYITAEDSVGNEGYWPAEGEIHSVRIRMESSLTTASRWSAGIPGGVDSTNYVFFSIPFDVGNAIGSITAIMGEPDEFAYRLYGYNNGWKEHTVETPLSVTIGNGYFFIFDPDKYSDTPNIAFDFGPGTSTPTDPPYEINISSGTWKFIGHPYNFNVSLNNVYTEDGTNINDAGSIYTWNNNWTGVSSLQPWQGYIYKSGGATKLIIDSRGDVFGKMAKTVVDVDNMPMDVDEWVVDIRATTGNMIDEMNAIGVRHIAKDGFDRLDEFEPPVVPGNLTLRVDNRDREKSPDIYAKDIRKPNKEGHFWDIQVIAPTNGERTYLTFDGLGYIPQEYDIFLINKTNKQAKNLEWESTYRFANTGSDSYLKQDLRLVIGTKKFVEENNAGVNLYPDAFTLSQNYPNPFNPQTSIMISLEEDAQVDLIIYNLLGEEITRLAASEYRPAGYYNFIWNGRNAMGTKVSTGVYFYHAMVRNAQGKTVLNKTKKMIFLK